METQKQQMAGRKDMMPVKKEAVLQKTDRCDRDIRIIEFQNILRSVMEEALLANNEVLQQEISDEVTVGVIKEMNYLMRMQEEQEDARFQKLDMLIRNSQRARRESAACKEGRRRRREGKPPKEKASHKPRLL